MGGVADEQDTATAHRIMRHLVDGAEVNRSVVRQQLQGFWRRVAKIREALAKSAAPAANRIVEWLIRVHLGEAVDLAAAHGNQPEKSARGPHHGPRREVCLADLNEAGARKAAVEIGAEGQAIACAVDVTDRSAVKQMVRRTAAAFGQLDVIFNNAGIAEIKPFLEVTEEDWNRVMRINALGVLICMQEAARQMIAQGKGGKIVNTSSIAGREGVGLQPHYCASKACVISLTQAGAREFGQHGITVNAFCPGCVDTDLYENLKKNMHDRGLSHIPGEYAQRIVLGQRIATPDDVLGLATFLASDESDYITGQSILVDGGYLII